VAALSDAQQAFLRDNPFVGVVTTVRADGGLHSTVVWVDVENGDALFVTLRGRAKEVHLAHDPRVSLLVADPGNPYRWLAVSGTAEISEGRAEERLDVAARTYLGRDAYPWRQPGQVWVECRIRADRIETTGLE